MRSAEVATRAFGALAAVVAAALFWQFLKPLLLHLFAERGEWLQAEPFSALLLLALLYGALLACLLTLFAFFPASQLTETRSGPGAAILVLLPVWLAPVCRLVAGVAGLPPGYSDALPILPPVLVTAAQLAHWWRMHTAVQTT